jgi:hypothetical protein
MKLNRLTPKDLQTVLAWYWEISEFRKFIRQNQWRWTLRQSSAAEQLAVICSCLHVMLHVSDSTVMIRKQDPEVTVLTLRNLSTATGGSLAFPHSFPGSKLSSTLFTTWIIELSSKHKIHLGTKGPDRLWDPSSLPSVCTRGSLSNPEVKNEWKYTSTPICFHSLIKDNFIF